jgi:hypothetical protein
VPRTLSHPRDTFLVGCLAALSFLPPAGWQVCVGADGHWEIEPVAIAGDACCDLPDTGSDSGAAAADDCSGCADFAFASGPVVGARPGDSGPEAAADAPCVMPDAALATAPAATSRPATGIASRSPRSDAEHRSPILRL